MSHFRPSLRPNLFQPRTGGGNQNDMPPRQNPTQRGIGIANYNPIVNVGKNAKGPGKGGKGYAHQSAKGNPFFASPSPLNPPASPEVATGPEPFTEDEADDLFEDFVARLNVSGRPLMNMLARKIVKTMSKKDLVFFVLRMKDGLDDRRDVKNRPPPDASRVSANDGRPVKRVKGNKGTPLAAPAPSPSPEVAALSPEENEIELESEGEEERDEAQQMAQVEEDAEEDDEDELNMSDVDIPESEVQQTTPAVSGKIQTVNQTPPVTSGRGSSSAAAATSTTTTRRKESAPASKYSAEFFPLEKLREENVQLDTERGQEFLDRQKRTQQEEAIFAQCLNVIESNFFFEADGSLQGPRKEELCAVLEKISVLCRKVKDYLAIWLALRVPQSCQADVAACFLKNCNPTISSSSVISCLMKNQRLKMNQAEELFRENPEFFDKAPGLLANIYPTPKVSFGWSRVGWNFVQWLDLVSRILSNAPVEDRLTRMDEILAALREHGLNWDEDRKEKLWVAAAELCGVDVSQIKPHALEF